MPKRDYVNRVSRKNRAKTKKKSNTTLILLSVILLIGLSLLGLWLLSKKTPDQPQPPKTLSTQKSELPSRPEEIYSYIRDLETREVPVGNQTKSARLSKSQEQEILRKQQEEQQKLAQWANRTDSHSTQVVTAPQTSPTADSTPAKALPAPNTKPEKSEKPTVPAKTVQYGLQCGAFKNKAQAENMQARLAMAGYNARIVSKAEWHRVLVGPLGDRSAANKALSNTRSVAECVVVVM